MHRVCTALLPSVYLAWHVIRLEPPHILSNNLFDAEGATNLGCKTLDHKCTCKCASPYLVAAGMMTGQILSGADPDIAARYQMMVGGVRGGGFTFDGCNSKNGILTARAYAGLHVCCLILCPCTLLATAVHYSMTFCVSLSSRLCHACTRASVCFIGCSHHLAHAHHMPLKLGVYVPLSPGHIMDVCKQTVFMQNLQCGLLVMVKLKTSGHCITYPAGHGTTQDHSPVK